MENMSKINNYCRIMFILMICFKHVFVELIKLLYISNLKHLLVFQIQLYCLPSVGQTLLVFFHFFNIYACRMRLQLMPKQPLKGQTLGANLWWPYRSCIVIILRKDKPMFGCQENGAKQKSKKMKTKKKELATYIFHNNHAQIGFCP